MCWTDFIFDFFTVAVSVGAFAVLTTIIHLFNFEDFKVLCYNSIYPTEAQTPFNSIEPLQSIQAACAVGTGHGILGAVCLWYSCSYWLGWQHQPKSCLHSSCPSSSHPPSYSNSLCFSPSVLSIMENWQLQHILWLLIIPFTPEHVCCSVVCVCFKKFRCVTH